MRSRRLKNEINVVPYIDVMLVLLVIFMVTAPMMTTASIDIPSVGKAVQAQPPANALQVEVSESEELTLIDAKQNRRRVSRSQLAQEIAAAQRRDPDLARKGFQVCERLTRPWPVSSVRVSMRSSGCRAAR